MKHQPVCARSLIAFMLFLWVSALFSVGIPGAQAEPLSKPLKAGAKKEPKPARPASERLPNDPGSELSKIPLAAQDLGWRLVGTAVADGPGQNFAILEDQSNGNQRAYREGDQVEEILIKKILDGNVVIGTGTGDALLSMVHGGDAEGLPDPAQMARLPRKEVDSAIPDEMHFMRQIGVRPRYEGGQLIGFVIYSIKAGSIFARMGLQDSDVIVGVNGKSFWTTQPTMEFYDVLKKGGKVSLEINREDSTQRLLFEIR